MREKFIALQREILNFLATPGDEFDDLAREVFRFQAAHNAPYGAYCDALGCVPAAVDSWRDAPAVPTEAFKSGPPLTCHPPAACDRLFLTSGTTAEVRGRHYLADLSLYEASVRHGWREASLPAGLRPLFLAPPPATTPHSSLATMFEILANGADPAGWLVDPDGVIRVEDLLEASASGQPILLFATALAMRHLLAHPTPGPLLPEHSWVFQTGGYKGLQETYAPAELYAAIETRLRVPPERVINEYGMTELSSPSYAIGLSTPHRTPPWLRVRAIDPETNRPNPAGEAGHLAFFDLANLNSVAAIRTRDLGHFLDDRTFLLLGRDASAAPRGCSRASDSLLSNS